MYTCLCIAESLHGSPETATTLSINQLSPNTKEKVLKTKVKINDCLPRTLLFESLTPRADRPHASSYGLAFLRRPSSLHSASSHSVQLLGLQWQDVNWEKNQIHIIRSRVAVDGKSVVKQPKTESGTRTLDVPEILMKKLKSYKVKCMEQKIRVGRRLLEEDFIIVHPDGKPIYPEYVSQMFTKLQKRANLPNCRFHDLRHLCASIMVKQGVEVKVAQERLGHKDITTTMNIYAHVLPGSAREAAEKIGQLVYKDQAV